MRFHRVLATSRVSKHRVFAWINTRVLPSEQTVLFLDDRSAFFAVLQSTVHQAWVSAHQSKLGGSGRYFRNPGSAGGATFATEGNSLTVDWTLSDSTRLSLRANFSDQPARIEPPAGEVMYSSPGATTELLPAWGGIWVLETAA